MVRQFTLACSFGLAVMLVTAGCGKKKDTAPDVVVEEKQPGVVKDKTWDMAVANLKAKHSAPRGNGMRSMCKYDAAESFPVFVALVNDGTVSAGERVPGEPNSAREAAVIGLLKYGPAGEKVAIDKCLPVLKQGLKDSDPDIKIHSALAIGLLGPKAKSAAGDLLILCESPEDGLRQIAFDALRKIDGSSPNEFVIMLSNADRRIVYDVAKALNAIRPLPKEIIPGLLPLIEQKPEEKDPEELALIRLEVAEMLGSFGSDAADAVPSLMNVLKATTEETFIKFYRPKSGGQASATLDESPVMAALGKIGKPAVPPLTELLDAKDPFQVWLAARVLGAIGPDAADAIPTLQKILDRETERIDSDLSLISACGLAIVQLGGEADPIVSKIAELLTISTPELRFTTARALARFGRKGGKAVPAMIKLLDDKEDVIRQQAIITLQAFGPAAKDAVPAIGMKLSDPDFDVRRNAVALLKALGPIAVETAPQLSEQLKEQDEALRREVLEAIIAMGPQAAADVNAIVPLLASADDRERLLALEALGGLGPKAKSALPALVKDFRGNSAMKSATLQTLGRIGVAAPEVVTLLGNRLQGDTAERKAAARALAQLGPAAKAAAPALQKLATSKDPAAPVWAAATLYRLGVEPANQLKIVLDALKLRGSANQGARMAAMEFADLLGPTANSIVPELIVLLDDRLPISKFDNTPINTRAVMALGKMGPEAKDAVKKLTAMLKESNPATRKAVIEALGQIGPEAKFAAARLREIVRTEPASAESAREALERIEPKQ